MILLLSFLLPVVVLVALVIVARTFWQSRRVRWMVVASVAAALLTGFGYLWAIFHSTSSTAAIGVLFVPLAMGLATPLGSLLGVMGHEARFSPRHARGIASLLGLAAVAVYLLMTGWRIAEFRRMQQESDTAVLARSASAMLPKRDFFVLAAIAANPRTPVRTLLEIVLYPDPGLHEKRNEWINSFDRDQLAVVRKVIRNPNAPAAVLIILAHSKNEYVLGDVAQDSRTPVDLLRELADKPHGYLVDWGLAANPSVPAEILQQLPYEKDNAVAHHLAYNTSTPVPLLEKLSSHPDASVRGAVAGNRSTPDNVLRALAQDKEEWVGRQADWLLKNRH